MNPAAPKALLPAAPLAPSGRKRRPSVQKIDPVGKTWSGLNLTQKVMLGVHGAVLLGVSYHGYKRNSNSVPWAAAWALGGIFCPTVTAGFALTQGFAEKTSKGA